jgi:hypothetical protein
MDSRNVPDEPIPLISVFVAAATLTYAREDRAYWLSRTPSERWQALELLRRIIYGYDAATARIQKVIEVVNLHESD